LGLILDLWAGGLSGGGCSQSGARNVVGNNVFFLALDPARLAGRDILLGQAADLATWIRATPRVPGVEGIILPGDPERRTLERRTAAGITIDDSHRSRLLELSQRLNVRVPLSLGRE
jgi:uncharacterized oxidoreductase